VNTRSLPVALLVLTLAVGYVAGVGMPPRTALAGPTQDPLSHGVYLTDQTGDLGTHLTVWRLKDGVCVGATRYSLSGNEEDGRRVFEIVEYALPRSARR
jgi:hypothetical protein